MITDLAAAQAAIKQKLSTVEGRNTRAVEPKTVRQAEARAAVRAELRKAKALVKRVRLERKRYLTLKTSKKKLTRMTTQEFKAYIETLRELRQDMRTAIASLSKATAEGTRKQTEALEVARCDGYRLGQEQARLEQQERAR